MSSDNKTMDTASADTTPKEVPTVFRERIFDVEFARNNKAYWLPTSMIVAFGLWHIVTNLYLNEPGSWQNCIHFGGFALIAAISSPTLDGAEKSTADALKPATALAASA